MKVKIVTQHSPLNFEPPDLKEVVIEADSVSFEARKENGHQIFILKPNWKEKHNG